MAASIVSDIYKIDEDMLHTKADNSDYWKTVFKFWGQIKNTKISELTEKQVNWLDRISDELEDVN